MGSQEVDHLEDLGTTQRYMHLSPAALDAAIRLLETGTDRSLVAVEELWRPREIEVKYSVEAKLACQP